MGELLILKHLDFLFAFSQENSGPFLGENNVTCLSKIGSTLLFREVILKAGGQKPYSDQGLEPHLSGAQVCLSTSELLGSNGLYSLLLGSHRKCVRCSGGRLLVYFWIVLGFFPLKVFGLCRATAKLAENLHYLIQDYSLAGAFIR